MRKPDRRLKRLRHPLVSIQKMTPCWENLIAKGSKFLGFRIDYKTYTGERSTRSGNVECEISDYKNLGLKVHYVTFIYTRPPVPGSTIPTVPAVDTISTNFTSPTHSPLHHLPHQDQFCQVCQEGRQLHVSTDFRFLCLMKSGYCCISCTS